MMPNKSMSNKQGHTNPITSWLCNQYDVDVFTKSRSARGSKPGTIHHLLIWPTPADPTNHCYATIHHQRRTWLRLPALRAHHSSIYPNTTSPWNRRQHYESSNEFKQENSHLQFLQFEVAIAKLRDNLQTLLQFNHQPNILKQFITLMPLRCTTTIRTRSKQLQLYLRIQKASYTPPTIVTITNRQVHHPQVNPNLWRRFVIFRGSKETAWSIRGNLESSGQSFWRWHAKYCILPQDRSHTEGIQIEQKKIPPKRWCPSQILWTRTQLRDTRQSNLSPTHKRTHPNHRGTQYHHSKSSHSKSHRRKHGNGCRHHTWYQHISPPHVQHDTSKLKIPPKHWGKDKWPHKPSTQPTPINRELSQNPKPPAHH